jgi:hypothetical protein
MQIHYAIGQGFRSFKDIFIAPRPIADIECHTDWNPLSGTVLEKAAQPPQVPSSGCRIILYSQLNLMSGFFEAFSKLIHVGNKRIIESERKFYIRSADLAFRRMSTSPTELNKRQSSHFL